MKKLNEDMKILDELIRKAYDLITPLEMQQDLKWYLNRDIRQAQQEKYPKCWLTLGKDGRDIPFFPICNVSGLNDKRSIDLSIKMAEKMRDRSEIDQDKLQSVYKKLHVLKSRYNQDIPKPANMAAKKANVTKGLNSINKYIKKIR